MICKLCRGAGYYAKKQGLSWARNRRERLEFYQHRIEYYEPRVLKLLNDAKKNVATIKQRTQSQLSNNHKH